MANSYQEAVCNEDKKLYRRIINFIGSSKENLENKEGQEIILELRRRINFLDFRLREEQKKQEESSKP